MEQHETSYLETLGWDKEDKWKLAFMCSIFGSRGVAQ
jgi:hypothetical protein